MKKLLFKSLMVVALASTIVSCEKEEDPSTNTSSIIGTWEATSERSIERMNGQLISDSTSTYAANELVVTFNADGTAYSVEDGNTDTATYSLNGNQLVLIDNDPVFGPDTTIFSSTITSTNLKLYTEYSEVYQGVTFSGSFELNFKKK